MQYVYEENWRLTFFLIFQIFLHHSLEIPTKINNYMSSVVNRILVFFRHVTICLKNFSWAAIVKLDSELSDIPISRESQNFPRVCFECFNSKQRNISQIANYLVHRYIYFTKPESFKEFYCCVRDIDVRYCTLYNGWHKKSLLHSKGTMWETTERQYM